MSVAFSFERWAKVKQDAARWWAGELARPLIQVRVWGRDPGRPAPRAHPVTKGRCYDFSYSAEEIVDAWDYELSRQWFLGDAFPCVWPDLGPGVLAAFLGAVAEPRDGEHTVWFHAARETPVSELRFEYQAGSPLAERVRDIYRAALARWQGLVQVGMTDLGGNLDVLASFRPSERLLLDLVDEPEEVKRATWEAHRAWFHYFEDLNRILHPRNPGYTAWTPIFSSQPYYMLQCDFCYMIGPRMFDEFVKPELAAACRRLTNPFYHLDGKGQLPHLDSLLEIKELKGVQWVPGAGQPDTIHWPKVYRKIRRAGKLAQIWGGPEHLDALAEQVGDAEGLVQLCSCRAEDRPKYEAHLRKYGAEAGRD